MKISSLIITTLLMSGCATIDKALIPVDNALNTTESAFQSAGHSIGETMDDMGQGIDNLKSGFFENLLIKMFLSNESISLNREKYFVVWNDASDYYASQILKNSLKDSDIKDPHALKTSDKMKILKDYFFQLLKQQHAREFSSKNPKPEFNEFLTDRENIEKIHQYKMALAESEYKWRIGLDKTQKKVAQLIL